MFPMGLSALLHLEQITVLPVWLITIQKVVIAKRILDLPYYGKKKPNPFSCINFL
jgi:hypothetical protein